MYKHYYVNNTAQFNGDHEVHVEGCKYMPYNKSPLGAHTNCRDAVIVAKRIYSEANGCAFCCLECHTS